jgi:hypothetical protein
MVDRVNSPLPGVLFLLALIAAIFPYAVMAADFYVARDLRSVPVTPTANDDISVSFSAGPCLGIADLPNQVDVLRTGQSVELRIDGNIASDITFCNSIARVVTFPIGALPAGQYDLHVTIRSVIPPNALSPPILTGALRAAPAPVPATNHVMLALLLLCMLATALLARPSRMS